MVPFAGFSMPVSYAGILNEHAAVRERAALFDLSHTAQYEVVGPAAAAWLDSLTSNAVGTLLPGRARYNVFLNDAGGCLDDVLVYRLEDRLLVVVNAANAAKMWPYLEAATAGRDDVALTNLHGRRALVAVQGPRSAEILAPLCNVDILSLKYYACERGSVANVPALVARTGYTGEDGFELFVAATDAVAIWRALLAAGRAHDLAPAGLGARDILRLEAGMPLYGFELDETISPLAGGQRRAVDFAKGPFVGRAALLAQRRAERYDRIAGVLLEGRVPARSGYPVFLGDERVGHVRSAAFSPSAGGRNIATVLVDPSASEIGTSLDIEIRSDRHPAHVVAMPFYRRPR